MSKRQDIKARNRRQIFWTLLFVFVTVTCMTVYDIKWRNYDAGGSAEIGFFYLSPDSDTAAIPDDQSTLYIWQGRLGASDKGVAVEASSISPRTFAQREVDMLFAIDELAPGQEQALADKIHDMAQAWARKNNMIIDIVFDIRRLHTDSETFAHFLSKWHDLSKNDYHARLLIDPTAATGPFNGADDAIRQDMLSHVVGLAIELDHLNDASEMKAAEGFGKEFIAFIPADADPDNFEKEAAQKMKYFAFYVKTLPAHAAAQPENTP